MGGVPTRLEGGGGGRRKRGEKPPAVSGHLASATQRPRCKWQIAKHAFCFSKKGKKKKGCVPRRGGKFARAEGSGAAPFPHRRLPPRCPRPLWLRRSLRCSLCRSCLRGPFFPHMFLRTCLRVFHTDLRACPTTSKNSVSHRTKLISWAHFLASAPHVHGT